MAFATREALVTPDLTAFKKLALNRIRHLLVVDLSAGQAGEAGRLEGIITDRDIRLALPSLAFCPDLEELYLRLEDLKVHQVMTRDLYTTMPDSPLAEAVDVCLRHKIGALPVLRDGTLVGIITETDLLRALGTVSLRCGASKRRCRGLET